VQATPEQARQMAGDAHFQAVLPYEPYYKLAAPVALGVAQEQPQSGALNVTTFPGQRDAALAALQALGAQLMGEDTGPFGPTLTVMVPPQSLVAVAQLPLAQEIEPYAPRRTLNDLTRVALGISTNTLYTTPNYLNLTGANVTVNMNDTGVDSTHPDFAGPNGIRLTGAPMR
jgi:subtilisin family serine protease